MRTWNGVQGAEREKGRAWWPRGRGAQSAEGSRKWGVVRALRLGEGGQEVGTREWKVRILKKPGVWGLGGRGGAWAWERWESGGGCGRRGGRREGVDSLGPSEGTLWTAKDEVGKWCPVWGGLRGPLFDSSGGPGIPDPQVGNF